ncbi:flagellar biosynthesis protein FlhB [Rhodoplanes sp. Z2-YC6860]|uniref:flagellar biosynthesis protein FlhB n=1 Tax=Rhodoplanes sp. Z2-YC6860 TaxID=674703 RepID=UPI00078E4CE7|nr:flagellar biosynthesis protein FlhB [Rhodoplanes sp. Z2-YC6860]AMN43278.1 flagellar biosynthesis protein FlhB [Rhodoplanes sp. Z2-YC6860]
MAEGENDSDRSEDPSAKRLEEALERGDVVKSQEVSTWFVIGAGALMLSAFSSQMSGGLSTTLRGIVANSYQIPVDSRGLMVMLSRIESEVLAAIALPLGVLALAALIGNVIQHRLVWSAESLSPKFSKISPLAGAKRLFSMQALVNFVKGLAKILGLGAVMTALLWPQRHRLDALVSTDILSTLLLTRSLALDMFGAVVAILFLIAAADYLYQYRTWFERQKMSMRELKEEFKQTEGDPMIKGKIRQLRQQRMRKRMMAAVPKASVVITNPTHYAVALQYEKGMEAPICVAKGADNMALKIREIAKQHSVPIVENPPLARALHASVEVDDEIPTEHYKAVAEVIGYITKLRRAASRR